MKPFLVSLFLICFSLVCQANPVDSLTLVHIGTSCVEAEYSVANGNHTFNGEGSDWWKKADDFDFACISLAGNFQITAKVASLEYIDDSTKAGIMIRNDLRAGSIFACAYSSTEYLAYRHRGSYRNSCKTNKIFTDRLFSWLRLIRNNNQFVFQQSFDGNNWRTVEIKTLEMQDTVYYGLAVASNLKCTRAKAVFDSVSIIPYDQPYTHEMLNAFTRSHYLPSAYVNDTFKIIVGVPSGYDSTKAITYPVAYHLDGGDDGWHYILRNYMADGQIPEVISVGIGYPGADMRERDFTTGFDAFNEFVKNELIPFIDKTYKTNPTNRTLFGYSLGGFCAYRFLFQYGHDMPFQNIIAGSSGLVQSSFDDEQAYYNRTRILPVNFYTTVGSEDQYTFMITNFGIMNSILEGRNYTYFNLKKQLNIGLTHDSNKEVSFRDGHLWILNQPLPPDLSQLSVEEKKPSKPGDPIFRIYPGHVHHHLNIKTNQLITETPEFKILNLSGQVLRKGEIDQTETTIDVSGFQPGAYVLWINSRKASRVMKFLID